MLEDIQAIEQALLETLLQLLPPSPTLTDLNILRELLSRLPPATLRTLPLDIQQQLQTYLGQAYLLNWHSEILH